MRQKKNNKKEEDAFNTQYRGKIREMRHLYKNNFGHNCRRCCGGPSHSWQKVGSAGLRSRYLSHAKGALYQLSYRPVFDTCGYKNTYQILAPFYSSFHYYLPPHRTRPNTGPHRWSTLFSQSLWAMRFDSHKSTIFSFSAVSPNKSPQIYMSMSATHIFYII